VQIAHLESHDLQEPEFPYLPGGQVETQVVSSKKFPEEHVIQTNSLEHVAQDEEQGEQVPLLS